MAVHNSPMCQVEIKCKDHNEPTKKTVLVEIQADKFKQIGADTVNYFLIYAFLMLEEIPLYLIPPTHFNHTGNLHT
jgi:hypothetical protein